MGQHGFLLAICTPAAGLWAHHCCPENRQDSKEYHLTGAVQVALAQHGSCLGPRSALQNGVKASSLLSPIQRKDYSPASPTNATPHPAMVSLLSPQVPHTVLEYLAAESYSSWRVTLPALSLAVPLYPSQPRHHRHIEGQPLG